MSTIHDILVKALPGMQEDLQAEAEREIAIYQNSQNLLRLTRIEEIIYHRLAETPGVSVAYAELLEVTGIKTTESLQVHKFRLRAKLREIGKTVVTKLGVGYSLEDYIAN